MDAIENDDQYSSDEESSGVDGWLEDKNLDLEKNYDMLRTLRLNAGFYYIEAKENNPTNSLMYYLDNLMRADPLKSFIDDFHDGLLTEALLSFKSSFSVLTEAILRYIASHKNIKFRQDNVVEAAFRSEYVFFYLIELGGNVHHKTLKNEFTALQNAILGNRDNIVKYLLDQNVDVNCYNKHSDTALHYAFRKGNLNIIELLLQKGADLYLRNGRFLTPLEIAINMMHFNTVSEIFNSELIANIITFDLVKAMFSRFCKLHLGLDFFRNDVIMRNAENLNPMDDYYKFFKFLYANVIRFIANYNTSEPAILSMYLNNTIFESKYWANALKVILTSEIALFLLEECISSERQSIYSLLIPQLFRNRVDQEDSIELFKLLLSLEMVPKLNDMTQILIHYGFKEEFQLLHLSLREDCLVHGYNQENPMEYLPIIFCGLEDDLNYNRIYGKKLHEGIYNYVKQYFTPTSSNANYHNSEINIPMPNILSLHELSRNSARKFIRNNRTLSPSDFISTVNSLPISLKYKNYILLRTKVCEF